MTNDTCETIFHVAEVYCEKCGKPIFLAVGDRISRFCGDCNVTTPRQRAYQAKYRRTHKQKSTPNIDAHRASVQASLHKRTVIRQEQFDEPCFFCEYGSCGGQHKAIVAIKPEDSLSNRFGKGVYRKSKSMLNNDEIALLLDRDRYIVCCSHHAQQIAGYRQHHDDWDFDDIIEVIVHGMTPQLEAE